MANEWGTALNNGKHVAHEFVKVHGMDRDTAERKLLNIATETRRHGDERKTKCHLEQSKEPLCVSASLWPTKGEHAYETIATTTRNDIFPLPFGDSSASGQGVAAGNSLAAANGCRT